MRKSAIDWYFPFVLGGLVLCGTYLAPTIFNTTTRWFFVFIAAMLGVTSVSVRLAWTNTAFKLIAAYLILCLGSALWSDLPKLSLYKAIAACLVSVGMFSIGYAWMQRRPHLKDIWELFYWLVAASIIVAVAGEGASSLTGRGGNYYAGLTGNSNYLGWMMAVSSVPILWKALDRHTSLGKRRVYALCLVLIIYYLLLSQSRAAMLIVLCSCFGLIVTSDLSRKILIFSSGALLLIITLLVVPGFGDEFYSRYVLKGNTKTLADAYNKSRGGVNEQSFAAAKQGGLLGAGYGVSIGAKPSGYRGGLSAVGYGREKGSSVLAIVEEVGYVGLVLVLSLFVHVFGCALKAYRMSSSKETRNIIGVWTGLLFGSVVHLNFEAWFVAPGSAESLFFWGYFGALYALYRRAIFAANERKRQNSIIGPSFE